MPQSTLRAALLTIVAVLVGFVPGLALAHGGHTGPTQTFTQAIGPYELAITVEIPSGAPAPLYLDIAPQQDMAGATMRFRAAPRDQSFDGAPVAEVQGTGGVARIPFTIAAQPLPAGSIGLFAALGGLVVLMIVSITLAAVAQRRGRRPPGWASWAIGQAMFACLIAAAIFGAQQFSAAIQGAQAASDAATTGFGRPHANMAVHTAPGTAQAGQPITLTIDLSDGATGLPIDDLVPHHEALLHLVVVSADGAFYAHVHPPRVGPGRYAIALTPDRPGRFSAYAEIQRQDSGAQLIVRDFDVGGAAVGPPARFQGLGSRSIDGLDVNVASSLAPPKAGRQATLTFSFSQGGRPVADLQPWLGMGGHLIARSADGAIFAHVHAAGPMAPSAAMATSVSYGPDISFVYTFPQPGRYQVWGQFRRAGTIVTVPLEVVVE